VTVAGILISSVKVLAVLTLAEVLDGWCYFPSVGTEIKCNNLLFSVRTDGNLYAYIRYFLSVGTENYS